MGELRTQFGEVMNEEVRPESACAEHVPWIG